MNELDPFLVLYNANVLKHRNLTWYGEDYPYELWRAWESLVVEEKKLLNSKDNDLSRLENEMLLGDKPKSLHDIQLSHQKESDVASSHEVGEGSESSQPYIIVDCPNTSAISCSITSSSTISRYDPDKPQLSLIPEDALAQPGSHTKEGILSTFIIFYKVAMLSVDISNLFSYFLSTLNPSGVLGVASLPSQEPQLESQAAMTEFIKVTTSAATQSA